jgi:hypothetical protein
MTVTLGTWAKEVRRIMVQDQPVKKGCKTLSEQKKAGCGKHKIG